MKCVCAAFNGAGTVEDVTCEDILTEYSDFLSSVIPTKKSAHAVHFFGCAVVCCEGICCDVCNWSFENLLEKSSILVLCVQNILEFLMYAGVRTLLNYVLHLFPRGMDVVFAQRCHR
eukprot:scpid80389/ scgid7564/ 